MTGTAALKNAHGILEKILNAMDTNHDGRISYTGQRALHLAFVTALELGGGSHIRF